jgi:Trk K+ transport system NAD-binding subunit
MTASDGPTPDGPNPDVAIPSLQEGGDAAPPSAQGPAAAAPDGPAAGHVIVFGIRGVGLRTVEQLRAAGVMVVAVEAGPGDADPVAEGLLATWGVPRYAGRHRESLEAAGLDRAAAVVCVPDEDLQAMEVALLVRRTRPDVRLVVRMGNTAVGRALAQVTGENSVLDVATLAAPPVVEACLGRRPRPVTVAGRTFIAAELLADRDGTLRELYGELAPIAARRGGETVVCPDRDAAVRAGDRVTALGTLEQFAAHGVGLEPEAPAVRHAAGARSTGAARAAEVEEYGGAAGLPALVRTLAAEADRPLRTTLFLLMLLSLLSVVVLRLGYVKATGEHMTVLDAVYFTVETIGTVGYGDFSFAGQAPWLRMYAIGLMITGVVLSAILFALLTELLVSSRIERSFGERRVGAMKGHVIVVGLGGIGIRVVEELLAAGRRVVVLERDPGNRHLSRARALGVPIVIGDATDVTVLATVNLASATAVAILTSDDMVNIETGLAVRDQLAGRWAEVPVVLRVFDRELGEKVREGFDFRYVRSTEALVAPWFVGAALGLDVLGTFYVGGAAFLVGHLQVAAGGGLDGVARQDISARTRVIAVHRAGAPAGALDPPPHTRFGAGDDVYLVGPYEELLAVLRHDSLGAALADGSLGGDSPGRGAMAT